MKKSAFIHINEDLLGQRQSISEGLLLANSYEMIAKIDWRSRNPKEQLTDKAKEQFLKDKKEADKNFKNETLWRGIV